MAQPIKKILFDAQTIQERVQRLGRAITTTCAGKPLHMIIVLDGAFMFAADLLRAIALPVKVTFIRASSYRGGQEAGALSVYGLESLPPFDGSNVLVVDDICDTGATMNRICEHLAAMDPGRPDAVYTCALINRLTNRVDFMPLKWCGFELAEGQFVVGYGLDLGNEYRDLPYIGVLK